MVQKMYLIVVSVYRSNIIRRLKNESCQSGIHQYKVT